MLQDMSAPFWEENPRMTVEAIRQRDYNDLMAVLKCLTPDDLREFLIEALDDEPGGQVSEALVEYAQTYGWKATLRAASDVL